MGRGRGKVTSEEIAEILGNNLARHRLAQGLTQDDVAYRAGLHRTEVSLLELGKRLPRADTLFEILGALGMDLRDAYEGAAWTPFEGKSGGYLRRIPFPSDNDESDTSG